MRTRAAPVLGALLALVLLAGGLVWVASSIEGTTGDAWELLHPPEPERCTEDDPTSSDRRACLTPSTLRLHDGAVARFGTPGAGAPIRSVTCWSEHAWNPSSDHPAGRACDFFPARYGRFPAGQDLEHGWAVADWLRDNAAELRVRYVIWQGRIWYRGSSDDGPGRENWGSPYNGGGVYDPTDATGGHFDHIHVSVRR
ncbi:hypothetical protein [Pseudonocardia phyllosphaerae]|uniref:hypothetical protein n=1 Tax=Pseudonocardia phyllosphaerae TaxID=3390502 RepID=UPI00397BC1B0